MLKFNITHNNHKCIHVCVWVCAFLKSRPLGALSMHVRVKMP